MYPGLLLLIIIFHVIGIYSSPNANYTNCTGYNQSRVYLETQSWWTETSVGERLPGRQVEIGVCFPLYQDIYTTTIRFHLIVKALHIPGPITLLKIQVWPALDPAWSKKVNLNCQRRQVCQWVIEANVNLKKATGLQEFRFIANIDSNIFGRRQFCTTRYPAFLRHNHAGENGKKDRVGAAGFVARTPGNINIDHNGAFTNALINLAFAHLIANGTQFSGIVNFKALGQNQELYVVLDPNFEGRCLEGGKTLYRGPAKNIWRSISFDSTKFENGLHRLAVRNDHITYDGISTGVFVVAIFIKN